MRTLFNVMDKIQINLEKLIKEKKLTSKEVAKRINITEANLSILKTGKQKAYVSLHSYEYVEHLIVNLVIF